MNHPEQSVRRAAYWLATIVGILYFIIALGYMERLLNRAVRLDIGLIVIGFSFSAIVFCHHARTHFRRRLKEGNTANE